MRGKMGCASTNLANIQAAGAAHKSNDCTRYVILYLLYYALRYTISQKQPIGASD